MIGTATTWTIWLSFTNPHRPVDTPFLGVCVVDVTDEEATAAAAAMRARYPNAQPGIGAGRRWVAVQKAHALGMHPGGDVGAQQARYDAVEQMVPGCHGIA